MPPKATAAEHNYKHRRLYIYIYTYSEESKVYRGHRSVRERNIYRSSEKKWLVFPMMARGIGRRHQSKTSLFISFSLFPWPLFFPLCLSIGHKIALNAALLGQHGLDKMEWKRFISSIREADIYIYRHTVSHKTT